LAPLLELPLPFEGRRLVDEAEDTFERDVLDEARAVEGRAWDGDVRVHVRALGVRGGLARLEHAARTCTRGSHAELRVLADQLLRVVFGLRVRRAVPRPGLRRSGLRGFGLRRAFGVRARAGQQVHRLQAVEGIPRVEDATLVER